jgi:hypothetical protein
MGQRVRFIGVGFALARCLAAGFGFLLGAADAGAATFIVTNVDDAGQDTLRQAIIDANGAGGSNTIQFAIGGDGAHTIALLSTLPAITGTLTIDGYTQAGSAANTNAPDEGGLNTQLAVEIVGGGLSTGFQVGGGSVVLTVQGLALHGFSTAAISGNNGVAGSSQINVYGNFIGTAIDGTALPALGNSGSAVRCNLSSCQVGGTQPWQRNVLSGNGGAGVFAAAAATIEGNLIGTDAGGTSAIPNGGTTNWPGVYLQGAQADMRVGCTAAGCVTAASRNVISGNHVYGIGVWDTYGQNSGLAQIKGNYVGTDWSGTLPLPNGDASGGCPTYCGGVNLQGGTAAKPATIIGGFGAGEANLIAFNAGAGIRSVFDRAGENFDSRANLVHHNHGVGRANIDIGAVGRTPNDAGDADTGANLGQNWPQIISASQAGSALTVTYLVDTASANANYPLRIDFYADAQGGGKRWLAQDFYPAVSAQAQRMVMLTLADSAPAIPFVATATDADGHTSEVSPAFDVLFEDDFE